MPRTPRVPAGVSSGGNIDPPNCVITRVHASLSPHATRGLALAGQSAEPTGCCRRLNARFIGCALAGATEARTSKEARIERCKRVSPGATLPLARSARQARAVPRGPKLRFRALETAFHVVLV